MISSTWQPQALSVSSGPYPASAQLSDDGKALTVQVVNSGGGEGQVTLSISGFSPAAGATVWTLNSTDLTAGNTPAQPTLISPVQSSAQWAQGQLQLLLPPNSFTVVTSVAA
jgi:alpha-L-arabinofuranosidase